METGIIIALITSVTSFAIAIYGARSSRKALKKSTESSEKLERLKFELDNKRKYIGIPEKHVKSRLDALGCHIFCIQKVKDFIHRLLNSSKGSLDMDTAKDHFSSCKADLIKCYEENLSNLEREESGYAHSSKNLIFHIEREFLAACDKEGVFFELGDRKNSFTSFLDTLTNYQNRLRDIRLDIILRNNLIISV